MDDLRVILLLTGAAFIAGVYLWTRLQQRPAKRKTRRTAPSMSGNVDTDLDVADELARMEQLVANPGGDPDWHDPLEAEAPQQTTRDFNNRVLVISVIAEDGDPFQGEKLLKAFANNDLVHGKKGIFERHVEQGGHDIAVFGIANLVKPGTFPRDMPAFTTPGVSLFLQLPCAIGALDAFDDFVNTAERLAVELAGELRDENHQLLTHQGLMLVREQLAEAQARSRVAAS
ncbi:cell division protein ZipA [Thiogranum longum]|uniref:Cell division protein ZipA n=1 Tax=Thiogranum longum TaxID=1537524 RepID=A0A4R1HE38_9GAMM|nr:cell division protein ZipA [Thiogranum longum]TCK18575.1 cell division protein ZipA [Thiogranum longum]